MSARDRLSNNLSYDRCGLTASMIVKAQDASNEIDCDAMRTTLTMQQSFLIVISWGVMTTTDKCKGRSNRLPCNNQNFMLLFTRCNDNRTVQCKDQRHKYAKVEYSEYAKEGVRAHQRRREHCQSHVRCQRQVHWVRHRWHVRCQKASTLSTPKTLCTSPRVSMASAAKEVASVKEGQNEPLAEEGDDEPLAKNGDWLRRRWAPYHKGNWLHMSCEAEQASRYENGWPCTSCQVTTSCIRAAYACKATTNPSLQ